MKGLRFPCVRGQTSDSRQSCEYQPIPQDLRLFSCFVLQARDWMRKFDIRLKDAWLHMQHTRPNLFLVS